MVFQYMGEHLHLICRHAGYEHVANPSSRQYGKAFLCATHKGISITFDLLLLLIIQKNTRLIQFIPSYFFLDVEQ